MRGCDANVPWNSACFLPELFRKVLAKFEQFSWDAQDTILPSLSPCRPSVFGHVPCTDRFTTKCRSFLLGLSIGIPGLEDKAFSAALGLRSMFYPGKPEACMRVSWERGT